MVATLLGKQRRGRCDIHGCGEICGTVVIRMSGPTGAVDPQRPALRSGDQSGAHPAQVRRRLECSPGGGGPRIKYGAALDTSQRTVFRTKRRYAEEGLDGVLHDHPQANRYRNLDDKAEAHPVSSTGPALIALACSDAPEGHEHWTLQLLADKVVELGLVETLSYETVRLKLKKTPSSRGGRSNGAFRKVGGR